MRLGREAEGTSPLQVLNPSCYPAPNKNVINQIKDSPRGPYPELVSLKLRSEDHMLGVIQVPMHGGKRKKKEKAKTDEAAGLVCCSSSYRSKTISPFPLPHYEACDGTLRGVTSPLYLRARSFWALCSDLEASLMASIFLLTMASRLRIMEIILLTAS